MRGLKNFKRLRLRLVNHKIRCALVKSACPQSCFLVGRRFFYGFGPLMGVWTVIKASHLMGKSSCEVREINTKAGQLYACAPRLSKQKLAQEHVSLLGCLPKSRFKARRVALLLRSQSRGCRVFGAISSGIAIVYSAPTLLNDVASLISCASLKRLPPYG